MPADGAYRVEVDERWPTLLAAPAAPGEDQAIRLPDKLVRDLQRAHESLHAAEMAVARWIKYAEPDATGWEGIAPIIDELSRHKEQDGHGAA